MSSSSSNIHASASRPRAITFSEFSALATIKDECGASKWYSAQDRNRFGQEMVQDALRRLEELAAARGEAIPREQLVAFLGIEAFATQQAGSFMARRRNHIEAVLSEQRRQHEQGSRDPKRLRSVSEQSSQWFRSRSHELAKMYLQLEDE